MDQIPPDLNVEKLAAEMAGNTMMDEKQMNDQVYAQIIGFLKTDKINQFRALVTAEERIKFIYKHEAYWPLLQVPYASCLLLERLN